MVGSTLKEAGDSFRKTFITNTLIHLRQSHQSGKILDVQRFYLSRLIKELDID